MEQPQITQTINCVLSDFQKISIEAIKNGKHSLICAGTGSGKTLPAEFAIKYFFNKGLKVIYTSPIKALSNQKYYDFKKKFESDGIQFGLITGDIKMNPNADCLIMTCEILRNNLFFKNPNEKSKFDLNVDQLGCVIFDEVHYINDKDRGHVWEETLIKINELNDLRSNGRINVHSIQLLMLSATLASPTTFINTLYRMSKKEPKIEIVLSEHTKRIVPLEHYSLIFLTDSNIKQLEKKSTTKLNNVIKIKLKDENNINNNGIQELNNFMGLLKKESNGNGTYRPPSKQWVINKTSLFLKEQNLLPAIFFSLSRKNVVKYAHYIESSLFHDEILNNEIKNQISYVINKLPNHHEYISLPEYSNIISLLEKGVCYHHAGMIPVFRELVELMFEKGYVKLLFATETFSVGINLPTKATIFDSLEKFDGNEERPLKPHEYLQMAGRAGRRSIDPVGYTFHLNNLFHCDTPTLKSILDSSPQAFISQFNLDYKFVFRMFKDPTQPLCLTDIIKFVENTSLFEELLVEKGLLMKELEGLELETPQVPPLKRQIKGQEEYFQLKKDLKNAHSLNKQKSIQKAISKIETKELIEEYNKYIGLQSKIDLKKKIEGRIQGYSDFVENKINEILSELVLNGIIKHEEHVVSLTKKGIIASSIQEVDPILFISLVEKENYFTNVDVLDIICSLGSLFENEFKNESETTNETFIKEWCYCKNDDECRSLLETCEGTDTFTFIKILLKLNNLIIEFDNGIKNLNEYTELSFKLSKAPEYLLKFVATNQSLYLS